MHLSEHLISQPTTRQKLRKEKLEFLNSVSIGSQVFGDVFTGDQLSTIAELLKQEYYMKGATIIREGESGNTFYIVQSGLVEIYKDGINDGNPLSSLGKQQVRQDESIQNGSYILDSMVCAVSTVLWREGSLIRLVRS